MKNITLNLTKNIVLFTLLISLASCSLFKKKEDKLDLNKIYTLADVNPEFPGGESELFKFLSSNVKYPQIAKEAGVQGRVYVGFVIERDGSISNAKILRGIGAACDNEALRVVNKMPKWKPGKIKDQIVRVRFNLPFNFKLR